MHHLEKELSNENLLFLTIVWQWRDILMSKKLINNPSILCKDDHIKLPSNVPLSSIVSMQEKHKSVSVNNQSHRKSHSGSSINSCVSESGGASSLVDIGSSESSSARVNTLTYHVSFIFKAIYVEYIERDKAPYEMYVNVFLIYMCAI